jgi:AI-2 transport protein TqsA
MATTPSSVAQTATGVAACLAILYFLRPVLVPFFLAVLLRILIAGIVSLAEPLAEPGMLEVAPGDLGI